MGDLHWEPILGSDLVTAARARLSSLSAEIDRLDFSRYSCIEVCNLALLSGYLTLAVEPCPWRSRATVTLRAATTELSQNLPSSLYGGFTGIGWTIEHLRRTLVRQPIDGPGVEDPLEEIDNIVLSRLQHPRWPGHYDLIGGLAGIGIFFLERLPLATAHVGIKLILNHLERQAEETSSGITWFTPAQLVPESQRQECPVGYYNLGLAHGVPGVVQFLGEVVAAGIEEPRAQRLLDGAVQWITACPQPPDAASRFSNWIASGQELKSSRLAWCYGDLGLAASLYHTAGRLGRKDWRQFAQALLDRCLARSPDQVKDAGLCHGAMGIAHIFNRAYQVSLEDRYKTAANYYYGLGLRLIADQEMSASEQASVPDISLLEGKVGIMLALVSALDPLEPWWDRRLSLSGCSRPA
jgi:lantibiotic biosynthesis protein